MSTESIFFPNSAFLTGALPSNNNNNNAITQPPPSRPPSRPPGATAPPGSMARQKCVEYERYAPTARYGIDKDCVPNHTYPIGGNPAIAREFAHMALLGYGGRPESLQYLCGGSLISTMWVMTAAHCLFADEDPVSHALLGELVRDRTDDDAYPQLIPVAQAVAHPDFKRPAYYNDIALLRLQWSPNMTTEHVRPACLQVDRQLEKEKVYLTGWGFTTRGKPAPRAARPPPLSAPPHAGSVSPAGGNPATALMEVALYRTKYEDCAKRYTGPQVRRFMPRGVDDETQLCAGADQLLKDACKGDSGGPIQSPVIKETCMYKLVGVVSLGLGCGFAQPGIYTRVSHYVPWIESVVWPDP
ncbi:hypothetical protein ONE63_002612 [Megalurothrips usitatus]|uniref:Peptidase S1 domain-containing protein n=1 Tax=Megalurothrips usitatus TaxID=439358 RepID=A0AAV7XFT8_9NEOP|nr:hypothetical protein ONE63_002612 [Megalurothrips usitatus]